MRKLSPKTSQFLVGPGLEPSLHPEDWSSVVHGTCVGSTNYHPHVERVRNTTNKKQQVINAINISLDISLHDSYFVESTTQIIIFSFSIFLQILYTP